MKDEKDQPFKEKPVLCPHVFPHVFRKIIFTLAMIFIILLYSFSAANNGGINVKVFPYLSAFEQELLACESLDPKNCRRMRGDFRDGGVLRLNHNILIIKSENRTATDVDVFYIGGGSREKIIDELDEHVKPYSDILKKEMLVESTQSIFKVLYRSDCGFIRSLDKYEKVNEEILYIKLNSLFAKSEILVMPEVLCIVNRKGDVTDKIKNFKMRVSPTQIISAPYMDCEINLKQKEFKSEKHYLKYGIACAGEYSLAGHPMLDNYNKYYGKSYDDLIYKSDLNGHMSFVISKDGDTWRQEKLEAEYEIEQSSTIVEDEKETLEMAFKILRRGKAISLPMSTDPADYKNAALNWRIEAAEKELKKLTVEYNQKETPKENKIKTPDEDRPKEDERTQPTPEEKDIQQKENNNTTYIIIFLVFAVIILIGLYFLKKQKDNVEKGI